MTDSLSTRPAFTRLTNGINDAKCSWEKKEATPYENGANWERQKDRQISPFFEVRQQVCWRIAGTWLAYRWRVAGAWLAHLLAH